MDKTEHLKVRDNNIIEELKVGEVVTGDMRCGYKVTGQIFICLWYLFCPDGNGGLLTLNAPTIYIVYWMQ